MIQAPGGEGPDGRAFHIPGVPAFKDGDKVLLFLVPTADGIHGILHWALGTFRVGCKKPADAVDS